MQIPDTPLFVKTPDFNLWLLQRTQRFPKHLRHSYTVRLENLAFEFEEALLLANQARGTDRRRMLHAADGKLLCLRVLMRYAYDSSPPADPQGPTSGSSRVLRGGPWGYYPQHGRSAGRSRLGPGYRRFNFGFRVVGLLD